MDAIDAELVHAQEERRKMEEALAAGAPMAVASVTFDTDLYCGGGSDPNRFAGYDTSIPASEEDAPEDDSEPVNPAARRLASYTGHAVAALFFVYAPLLFSVDSGPSFAEQPRVAVPRASSGPGPGSEVQVRVLVSMAGGLYPLARAEALRGLAAVLEKADADGGVVECCYGCAVELLRDDGEGVRLAAVRLIGLCVEKFAAREEVDGNGDGDQMDLIFLQLSSMARDMCTKVRIEAFNALAKIHRVSEGVFLQSLSKKAIKTDIGSGSISKGKKLPPRLLFPCAAGIFAHGIEDEFYQVRTVACKSLGALAKFSTQYAQNALDLLMDMMNDDTEAVRLQTLQTLFHMATYGYLSVQEKHMHMLFYLYLTEAQNHEGL